MQTDIYSEYFQISDQAEIFDQFSGNESSKLLVILPEGKEHLDLVEKIMGAIKVQSLEDIRTLTLKQEDKISLYPLLKNQPCDRILVFGFDSPTIGIQLDFKPYILKGFKGRTFLFTADLETISQSPEHKKALWTALKNWID